jgi:hypothetical protein
MKEIELTRPEIDRYATLQFGERTDDTSKPENVVGPIDADRTIYK